MDLLNKKNLKEVFHFTKPVKKLIDQIFFPPNSGNVFLITTQSVSKMLFPLPFLLSICQFPCFPTYGLCQGIKKEGRERVHNSKGLTLKRQPFELSLLPFSPTLLNKSSF